MVAWTHHARRTNRLSAKKASNVSYGARSSRAHVAASVLSVCLMAEPAVLGTWMR